jgi:5-(carboxyamino)imidazole ribonucleotide synthase
MRAILGLPLGECNALGPSAMINLIGVAPDPAVVLRVPGAYLHLYDKAPRPGRKIGHITVCADEETLLVEQVAAVQRAIGIT